MQKQIKFWDVQVTQTFKFGTGPYLKINQIMGTHMPYNTRELGIYNCVDLDTGNLDYFNVEDEVIVNDETNRT